MCSNANMHADLRLLGMSKDKDANFEVDGKLLMILPSAVTPLKNPDVQMPILRSDATGHYLEMRSEADPASISEIPITRRIPLNDFTQKEWEQLKEEYAKLNFQGMSEGVSKSLENIKDRRVQRLFLALLTFLNPRQVAVILNLYRLAAQQGNGPEVTFESNDLLEALGYTRTKNGSFDQKTRSLFNQDLVALHRIELVFARSLRGNGNKVDALVTVKSILRIKSYMIKNLSRNFDLSEAADYTYQLADRYTVNLEFFDGSEGGEAPILFADAIDIKLKNNPNNSKFEYKVKLLTYLASRLKWDTPKDGQFLVISRSQIFKILSLFGRNSSRNNQIFWRTIEELKIDGYILMAQEVQGKNKVQNIELQINPEKIRMANS